MRREWRAYIDAVTHEVCPGGVHVQLRELDAAREYTLCVLFFFQAEDGIRDLTVTGVQTCALPILRRLTCNRPRTNSRCRGKWPPGRSRILRTVRKDQGVNTVQFLVGGKTKIQGKLATGAEVTVEYRSEEGSNIALRAIVTPGFGMNLC